MTEFTFYSSEQKGDFSHPAITLRGLFEKSGTTAFNSVRYARIQLPDPIHFSRILVTELTR